MFTRGFRGKRPDAPAGRLPPGQHLTEEFPVLSAGPTPPVSTDRWSFRLEYRDLLYRCTWSELLALPATELTVDIHCVTKWTKLDTRWKGVSFDDLMAAAGVPPPAPYLMAFCDGGYTTNVPVADLQGGKALVAYQYDGKPLPPAHGGPVRLFVPHLYFWKSAKWLRGLRFMDTDQPGFWEANGYHMYGDPWKEQRYAGD
jgi:DMSO/TMAO reductase YedYZ molybdopterin-dependent catalytic subunit